MGYRFGMQSFKDLDHETYMNSGLIPIGSESILVEFARSFTTDVMDKDIVDHLGTFTNIRLVKHPIRKLVEQDFPEANFNFFDGARDTDLQSEKGPWVLYDPVQIHSTFKCLQQTLKSHADQLLKEFWLIERDYEISEYSFRNAFEFCDQAIKWNQKVITSWG